MNMSIKPQAGPQTQFLSSQADIVIYGGARGGGKTYGALMEPLRHVNVPGFSAVLFRRTFPELTNAGGAWPKAADLYPAAGGISTESKLQYDFPSSATIAFRHMKEEKHKYAWQGLQVCLLLFEELTHFSETQIIFMLGSNRSTCGVRPYLRATCNPDADSWVKRLVEPYLAEDGYANLDEIGKIRYITVIDNQFTFVDEDWRDAYGNKAKTFTFINADVWDNQILLKADPQYLANLAAQNEVDRERFLGVKGRGGNWKTRAEAGKVFKSQWFRILDRVESGAEYIRFWDLAATEVQQKGDDPDWTVGTLMQKSGDRYVVLDVERQRLSPGEVDRLMVATAARDGHSVPVRWFRDPGQAGIYQDRALRKLLSGFDAAGVVDQMGKKLRVNPLSAAVERGEVQFRRGDWNQVLINECVGFPDAAHDDIPDSVSGAYNQLSGAYGKGFRSSEART